MLHSDLLAIAIQVNQTAILVGPPGVGKTAITKELVRCIEEKRHGGKKFPLVFQSLAQIMPEDLAGAQVPNHTDKTMDSYAMGSIKELIRTKTGVYFGDEYGSCTPSVRAAFLNAAQDRLFGDTHLPDVSVVCAMNPPDVATNGQDMTAPESNRFFWIYWNLDHGPWFDWMRNSGGTGGATAHFPIVPSDYRSTHLMKARSLIASFLHKNPMMILQMPTPEKATGPWPSNRSWANAANMLAAVLSCNYELTSDQVCWAVAGCVGKPVADTFFAWLRDMDLPDPELILKSPKDAKKLLPKRHDRLLVCMESVATAACEDRKDKVKRWEAAWDVINLIIDEKQDAVHSAAHILAKQRPPGADFPAEIVKILKLRRDMGIAITS